jgi:hypothetical protein
MPNILLRVVWGFEVTMDTFWPSTALRKVDFPTLGLPIIETKPERKASPPRLEREISTQPPLPPLPKALTAPANYSLAAAALMRSKAFLISSMLVA